MSGSQNEKEKKFSDIAAEWALKSQGSSESYDPNATLRANNLNSQQESLPAVTSLFTGPPAPVAAPPRDESSSNNDDNYQDTVQPSSEMLQTMDFHEDTLVDTIQPTSAGIYRPAHHRGVSWDFNVKEPGAYAPERSPPASLQRNEELKGEGVAFDTFPRPPRHRKRSSSSTTAGSKASLKGIIMQQPVESEAETHLIAALDEAAHNPRPRANTSSSILQHVAKGSERAFEDPSVLSGGQASGSAVKRPRMVHRRQVTMEQRLDGLSDVLEAIHDDQNSYDNPLSSDLPQDQPMGSADTMHKATKVLIQRRKRTEDEKSIHSLLQQQNHLDAMYEAEGTTDKKDDSTISPPGVVDVEEGGSLETDPPISDTAGESNHFVRQKSERTRCQKWLDYFPLLREFGAFLSTKRTTVTSFILLVLYIVFPAVFLSAMLFYFAGNPPTGRIDMVASERNETLVNHLGEQVAPDEVSVSWWLLFLGVRQMTTLALANLTQFFIIDFLCVGRRWTSKVFGPIVTLLIVQARGWPFVLIWWSLFNLGLNTGSTPFVSHWLYFQSTVGIFRDNNPSGNIPAHPMNIRLCIIALCVCVVVSVKRTWIGFFLGRKTYVRYAEELAKVMKTLVLLSKVATLAKSFENDVHQYNDGREVMSTAREYIDKCNFDEEEDTNDSLSIGNTTAFETNFIVDPAEKDRTGAMTEGQRIKIARLLGAWEEPDKIYSVEEIVSVRAILKFRQSLTFLDTPFVFSYAFGRADRRETCVESSQAVYFSLLQGGDSDVLNFERLALLALRADGSFHNAVLKDLITLFRPNREGKLSLLDFVKSVDAVYKKTRLLRAAIHNSQKIDRAFELIINVVFYTVMVCVTLSQLGFDPLALFLSLSSVIVAFAFMIGTASAKYFEGLLFILVQKPFDIGDRINIESPEAPGQPDGSAAWIVKDVTLFTTTVLYAFTNEVATISNAALARMRIINGARSPQAVHYLYLKFGVEVPYSKIQVFYDALYHFIRSRPREWISLDGFFSTDVHADQGYIQYMVRVTHRSNWNEVLPMKRSLAEVRAFCLELSKKMDIRYKSPPLPVNLTMEKGDDASSVVSSILAKGKEDITLDDLKDLTAMFEKRSRNFSDIPKLDDDEVAALSINV